MIKNIIKLHKSKNYKSVEKIKLNRIKVKILEMLKNIIKPHKS